MSQLDDYELRAWITRWEQGQKLSTEARDNMLRLLRAHPDGIVIDHQRYSFDPPDRIKVNLA